MKKHFGILGGIFVPLYYYLVKAIFLYLPILQYSEKCGLLQNMMIFILPSLSGVGVAIFMIRNSMGEFFKSLGICFFVSVLIISLYEFSGISLKIYSWVTGYSEFSLGEGFLMAIISMCYIVSCFIGVIIAGGVSLYKQVRDTK